MAEETPQPEPDVTELFEEDTLPVDPGEAFEQAEEGIDAEGLVVSVEPEPVPVGRSWAFDFAAKRFVMAGHSPVETHGNQTLLYWIEKCLRTPQGALAIEPPDYGFDDPTGMFGHQFDAATIETLEERVREALLFHPSISGIEEFSAQQSTEDEEVLEVSFTVVLDDDTQLAFETTVSQ